MKFQYSREHLHSHYMRGLRFSMPLSMVVTFDVPQILNWTDLCSTMHAEETVTLYLKIKYLYLTNNIGSSNCCSFILYILYCSLMFLASLYAMLLLYCCYVLVMSLSSSRLSMDRDTISCVILFLERHNFLSNKIPCLSTNSTTYLSVNLKLQLLSLSMLCPWVRAVKQHIYQPLTTSIVNSSFILYLLITIWSFSCWLVYQISSLMTRPFHWSLIFV